MDCCRSDPPRRSRRQRDCTPAARGARRRAWAATMAGRPRETAMRPLRLLPLLLALACGSPPVAGAKPELNADFRKPDVDVERWVGTLESESREIAAQRTAIT